MIVLYLQLCSASSTLLLLSRRLYLAFPESCNLRAFRVHGARLFGLLSGLSSKFKCMLFLEELKGTLKFIFIVLLFLFLLHMWSIARIRVHRDWFNWRRKFISMLIIVAVLLWCYNLDTWIVFILYWLFALFTLSFFPLLSQHLQVGIRIWNGKIQGIYILFGRFYLRNIGLVFAFIWGGGWFPSFTTRSLIYHSISILSTSYMSFLFLYRNVLFDLIDEFFLWLGLVLVILKLNLLEHF